MFKFEDYREVLKHHLDSRTLNNPRYSLRAYARDLGVTPSMLSEVLKGKHGLSIQSARKISSKLGLNEEEVGFFCSSVESIHAKSTEKKNSAVERIKTIKSAFNDVEMISLDVFKVISEWQYFAILELTTIPDFIFTPQQIAKTLGVTVEVASRSIERLKRVDLLRKRGKKWVASSEFSSVGGSVPSEAIRTFHQQILKQAAMALMTQEIDEREFTATLFATDRRKIKLAKDRIREFSRGLAKELKASKKKNSVYCFSLQLFEVSKKENDL